MQKYKLSAILLPVFVAFLGWYFLNTGDESISEVRNRASTAPQRIISTAPSITETLFTLGMGDRLVGRTRYCVYPEAALKITDIGGFFDPNYELILSLEPDLIITFPEHQELRDRLAKFKIPALVVNQRTITGMKDSFIEIAAVCGVPEMGQALASKFMRELDEIAVVTDSDKRTVLVCVGRDSGSGVIKDVYIAGNNNYYSELLDLAGAQNAYQGDIDYPVLSAEGIISLDPDIILEINVNVTDEQAEDYMKDWQSLTILQAVQHERVFLINQQVAVVSGPRLPQLLEILINLIHPELREHNK